MTILAQPDQNTAVVPEWVADLDSFRRWAASDEFPQSGWYSHLNGELWVDTSMETGWHNQLKTAIAETLSPLAKKLNMGRYFGDRMLLVNPRAEIGTEPDGMFVSHDSLAAGLVELKKGMDSTEVVGIPDMVLEVVSRTSVRKDKVVLRKLYHKAKIREYWIVDALSDRIVLDLFVRHSRGYLATANVGGWFHSPVFGRKFRLSAGMDRSGLPDFNLEVQE